MPRTYPPEIEQAMRGFFEALPERDRRLYAALEVAKLGRGGLTYLTDILGCDPKTIRRGKAELARPTDLPAGNSRKKGVDANP